VVDRNTIEARFWERGAGETASSGTGSTGAAVASVLTGRADSPVRVRTAAGDMELEWDGEEARLRGPAVVLAQGVFLDARP
jgi:diaminopimelate epimerase